jgi:hypothetical protein
VPAAVVLLLIALAVFATVQLLAPDRAEHR